jgi:hypothetical protein
MSLRGANWMSTSCPSGHDDMSGDAATASERGVWLSVYVL